MSSHLHEQSSPELFMICWQFCNKFKFHLIFELTKVGISFPSIDSRHHSTRGEGSPETFKVTLMMMFTKIRSNLLAPFYNVIKTLDCENFSWERNSNGIQSRSRSHEKRKQKKLNLELLHLVSNLLSQVVQTRHHVSV